MDDLGPDPLAAAPAPVTSPSPPTFPRVGFGRMLTWLLVTGPVFVALVVWRFGRGAFEPSGGGVFVLSAWLYAALLAWFAWGPRRAGLSIRRLLGPRPTPTGVFEAALVALLHLQLSALSFMAFLVGLTFAAPALAERLLTQPDLGGPLVGHVPRAASFALLVLVGPFVEEVLFRGLMFHRVAARFGVRRAAVATSLAFAVLHLNPFGILAFGLMLNVLYLRTRSLWTCIVAHALNNLVPFVLLTAAGGRPAPAPAADLASFRAQAVPSLVLLVLVGALWVAYMIRRWPARDAVTPWAANGPAPAAAAGSA